MNVAYLVVSIVGIIAAVISGGCWIRAASIKVPLRGAILSGPRADDVQASNRQSWWNAMAALAAAVAAICQGITMIIGLLLKS
jgi:hypothetical protein